jgi:hypothetical protein
MENEIEKILVGLVVVADRESEENNRVALENLVNSFNKDEELYEAEVSVASHNFSHLAALPFLRKNPGITGKDRAFAEFLYDGTVLHYLRMKIMNEENFSFSGDKVYFIIRTMKKALAENTNISLYATYGDSPDYEKINPEKRGEQAYWSPSCFKDTDEVKEKFWEWWNMDKDTAKPLSYSTLSFDGDNVRAKTFCPNCGTIHFGGWMKIVEKGWKPTFSDIYYCSECGQKIDPSRIEEKEWEKEGPDYDNGGIC